MTKRRSLHRLEGDISKQEFCIHCNKPILYYFDKPFTCQACRKETSFTAAERKKWIEEFKFHPHTFPKECRDCRKRLRQGDLIKMADEVYKAKEKTKKKTYVIDGRAFSNLNGFYDQVQKVLTDNFKGFGRNYDAFNDILNGGFSRFDNEPIILIWSNFEKSKKELGEKVVKILVEIIQSHKDVRFRME